MKLYEYVARRLVLMLFVLLGVITLTFILSRGVPGVDPLAPYVTERTPVSQYEAIRQRYHLNDPLPLQFFYYVGTLLQGDLGYSRTAKLPVSTAIMNYFPATLELTLAAIIIAVGIGIPLGIISALNNNKAPDHASRMVALTGVSIPVFWFALMLQLVFFYYFKTLGLPYLPSNSRVGDDVLLSNPVTRITGLYFFDSVATGNLPFLWSSLTHIILPAFALSFISMGVITRITRSSMLEVLRQDYIMLARSKGLSERVVIYRHALKNALIPIVTVTGLTIGGLMGGAVLTETVFAWPGLGRWSTQAILTNDTAGIMGFVLLAGIITVLTNLIVDILYAYLDPRIKY